MLDRLLHIISTLNIMRNDDWRERIKQRNKIRLKIIAVLFAVVIVGCLFVRIIS